MKQPSQLAVTYPSLRHSDLLISSRLWLIFNPGIFLISFVQKRFLENCLYTFESIL